jgi:DNA-binding transcriptional MocR family regulator
MKHLYETVAETVIARIEQGVYKPGEKLPGVRRLSKQLDVSSFRRQTIVEPQISDAPVTPAKVTGQSLTRQILRTAKNPYLLNLGASVPHADFLPAQALQQATSKVARSYGKRCFDTDELLGGI